MSQNRRIKAFRSIGTKKKIFIVIGILVSMFLVFFFAFAINHENLPFFHYSEQFYTKDCFWSVPKDDQLDRTTFCYERQKLMQICNFEIHPKTKDYPRILVIGTSTALGQELLNLYRKQKLNFIEVRNDLHFNTSHSGFIDALEILNINIIIDLREGEPDDTLVNYSLRNRVELLKKVQVYTKPKAFHQIQIPPTLGYEFLNNKQNIPGKWIWSCFANNTLPESMIKNETFVFAKDAARELLKATSRILKNKEYEVQPTFKESFTTNDILKLLSDYNSNCHQPNSGNPSKKLKEEFNMIINNARRDAKRRKGPIYTSLIVPITTSKGHLRRFNLALQSFDRILKYYPGISLEIVIVFCTDQGNHDPREYINISSELKGRIRFVVVPNTFVIELMNNYEIDYFPEFIIKNIGIRRARGEYIFSSNGDVIPPPDFFRAVQERDFSPLSYVRTKRTGTHRKTAKEIVEYWESDKFENYSNQATVDTCKDKRFYDVLQRNACGDFQGGHREIWNLIYGFVESKHVFHVDSMLGMDFSAIPTQLLFRQLPMNLHIEHQKKSKDTKHLAFYDSVIKSNVRHGMMSRFTSNFSRPNWGYGNMHFNIIDV